MNDVFKCCFCGKVVKGFGNNPYPANKDDNAMCCDDCNSSIVIPARIEAMFSKKEGD